MDTQIRIILLVIGLVILIGVAIDYLRRRPRNEVSSRDELFSTVIERKKKIEQKNYIHDLEYLAAEDDVLDEIEPEILDDTEIEPESEAEIPAEYIAKYESEETPEVNIEPKPVPRIINISIMSRERYGFKGADLINALTNAHFYFGKNDLFHRFENEDGSGELLFSLANAREPGYFYLDLLKQEHVSGVTLILLPDNLTNPQFALDKLIRAAKQIAFALNGELLDHKREALTLTTINSYAAQIQANAS